MDDNSFLNSYKNKPGNRSEEPQEPQKPQGETPAPGEGSGEGSPSLRYEQRSRFVRPPRRATSGPPQGPRGSKLVVPIVIGAVAVIAIVTGIILYLNRGVEVMDFTGWTKNDVQLWASASSVNVQLDEQFNDKVDEGRVISQSPAEGAKVRRGEFVKVVVSKGHDLTVSLPLPDLMNMTKDEIDAWAAANFMTKVRITTEFSNEVETGRVISFEINDNTVVNEVKRNTPVYIIVSKGREEEAVLVTVPDFREKTVSECYVFANENGLLLKIDEQYDDYAPKGAIIAQSVKADEKIKKGDEITLTVSKGKKIVVPNFASYSKQKASTVATGLGIPLAVTEKYSSLAAGKFISQSIVAGSVYQDGDVLELTYSLGNKIVIGSFVGQTRDAIENWAKELNDQGASITIGVTYTQSNAAKGSILYQDKANTVIGVKTTIKITVSKGKAVFVPDFVAPAGSAYDVAVTRDEAMAMCEAVGLIPVFVEARSSNRLPGEIWYQSAAAGREVAEGTTITLKYAPANVTVTVPNLTGKTKSQILSAGYGKKFTITFVVGDQYVAGYEGKAYKQTLASGTTVASGTAITIYIGAAATGEPTPPTSSSPEPTAT